jgi:hypothetical protein
MVQIIDISEEFAAFLSLKSKHFSMVLYPEDSAMNIDCHEKLESHNVSLYSKSKLYIL